MPEPRYSMLRICRDLLGMSSPELAEIIGATTSHVQAIIADRYWESLSGPQIRALMAAARLKRDQAIQAVEELELMG